MTTERIEQALLRQSERLERRIGLLRQRSRRYSFGRVAALLGGVLIVYLMSLWSDAAAWCAGVLAVGGFAALAVIHDRVEQGLKRHMVWNDLTLVQIARIRRDWPVIPLPDDTAVDPRHPFAGDLAVCGPRSLQHLIDTTASSGGSERLRSWLLHPLQTVEEIAERREAVQQLVPMSLFRKKLALHGSLISRSRWNADALFEWLDEQGPGRSLMPFVVALAVPAVLTVVSLVLWLVDGTSTLWMVTGPLYLAAYGVVYIAFFSHLQAFANAAVNLRYAVERLQSVLLLAERTRTEGALGRLLEPLHRKGERPSDVVRTLPLLARAAGLQHNVFAWVILNALVPWNLFFYDRLNRIRSQLRDLAPLWLDRLYELEASCALAEFAALHPHYSVPVVASASEGRPLFEAKALGHPLLTEERRVCNDAALERPGSIVLITGSNMSGKSTFLRTVGINLVLAFAGSVVTADALRTAPMRLFSSMAVSDSVVDGVSFFYAEVQRLKALLDEAQRPDERPLVFLVDEIFRGTNNRERLAGSAAFIRALAQTHALGLVSTHDLELVHLAEDHPGLVNFHFREDVIDGRMVFDYRIRKGPCPTTNALRIMAMEGLPVE